MTSIDLNMEGAARNMDRSNDEHFLLLGTNRLVMDAIGYRLRKSGREVSYYQSVSEILARLKLRRSASREVILTDMSLPGFSSLGIVTRLRQCFPDLPILVLHGPRIHKHLALLDELNIRPIPLRFDQECLERALCPQPRRDGNLATTDVSESSYNENK